MRSTFFYLSSAGTIAMHHTPVSMLLGNRTQSFMHARQTTLPNEPPLIGNM